ncbi:hypothetical protein ABE096_21585 [Robertmurraya massiliosenegalensis]|uniref:hypothetical protein n=1 Tax=Robertmurraya TaxID=2837507 RepID=UPI0039A614BA
MIQYGKVDMAKIDELILQGVIPKSIVSDHRILKDIRLDFVNMDLVSQEKSMQYFRNKQIQTNLKRFA